MREKSYGVCIIPHTSIIVYEPIDNQGDSHIFRDRAKQVLSQANGSMTLQEGSTRLTCASAHRD